MTRKYTHLGPGVLGDEFNPEAGAPEPNEPRGPFNKLADEYVPADVEEPVTDEPTDPEPPSDPEPPTD